MTPARACVPLLAIALVAFVSVSLLAPDAAAQANVSGQWQTLPNPMPINPVHVALMRNGKVLVVSGSGNVANNPNFQAGVFDPQTGTVSTQPVNWDMFCNGMVVLPDGRVFVSGGTLQYDPFLGESRTSVYDPATGLFTDVQSMGNGRWYPTLTVLGDGTVMTFSGLTGVNGNGSTNTSVEIYTVGTGWSQEFQAGWSPPLYPRMHLLPDGTVFYSGSGTGSRKFSPVAKTWTGVIATTNFGGTRGYGTSVLLPLTPASNYRPRVMIFGGSSPATATTEIIDLSAPTPAWQFGPSMSQAREQMSGTILPNGKVLAMGGSVNDEDVATASLNADLYDPVANTFSSAGQNAFPRLYHSVSLLLPDATVWFTGGNPQRGSYEQHMEIYSPPYLFNSSGGLATRPTITTVPAAVGYGAVFQIQTPDAASISSIALVRPGSPTHAFDQDQRLVNLTFAAGSGVLNATAPPNGNIAPPGYYMLFILNSSGVPSVAKFVQISSGPANQPPTATITSPTSDVTIMAGQSVFFSGTGSDSDGTIASYSWVFPGGSPGSSTLANPGNVTYPTPGSYTASFTVTDNGGLASSPATRVITVNGAPDTTPPTAPSGLGATAVSSVQINLNWTASTDNVGVTNYLVERCQGAGCANFVQIATPAGTTYSDTGLSASTPYSYRVRATDAASNLSGYSNVASATTLSYTPPPGLLAAYGLNEGTGLTTVDVSGGGRNGTLTNGASWAAGKYGNAVSFDGVNDAVSLPNSLDIAALPFTVEAWIRPSNFSDWHAIFTKRSYPDVPTMRFDIGLAISSGTVYLYQPNKTLNFSYAPPLNTWTHIALAADSTGTRLYVNGVLNQTLGVFSVASGATAPVMIGNNGDLDDPFAGLIDEVRIYIRALSQAEIQTDMNTPVGGTLPPDTTPPTAPSGLGATAASSTQVNLTWTASTDNIGVTGYLLERCQGAGCANFAQIATPTGTTYNDTGLSPSTPYSYRVRATDAANNLSGYSNVANATTPAPPDTTPPTAPSNLTATANGTSQIDLSWTGSTDNVGVANYLLERCQGVGCANFAQIATPAATTFSDTGRSAGTSYSYRVRATDAAANLSAYSNTASATTATPPPDTTPPTAPTGLAATAVGGTQINLSWTGSTDNVGVTGYSVERCQGAGCANFAQIATPTATTYSDTGLSAATAYGYRVRAADAANNLSGYSNVASATTQSFVPPPGLVAAYGFNEASGPTTADASGNGFTGTLVNNPARTAGKYGSALQFNATDNGIDSDDPRVVIGTNLNVSLPFTFSAWVNPASFADWRAMISKRDYASSTDMRFDIGLSMGSGQVYVYTGTSFLGFSYAPPVNTWTHLAVVAESTGTKLYVNGVLQQTLGAVTLGSKTAANVAIGGTGEPLSGDDDPFSGKIDDLRLYSRALTQAEIQNDMNIPLP